MSMLSSQAKELREAAGKFEGYQCGEISWMLREAADTIESLRKQVAKCQIAELKADYDTSRYFELFGTPDRTARTLAVGDRHADCGECIICEACHSSDMGCLVEEPDVLLEWLRCDSDE